MTRKSRRHHEAIELVLDERTRVISPREYVALVQNSRGSIVSVRVISPRLGARGFGSIEVTEKSDVFTLPRVD